MKLGICAAFGPFKSIPGPNKVISSYLITFLHKLMTALLYMFRWKESKVHNLLYVLNVVLSPICAPFQLQCLISPSKHTSSLHFIIGW